MQKYSLTLNPYPKGEGNDYVDKHWNGTADELLVTVISTPPYGGGDGGEACLVKYKGRHDVPDPYYGGDADFELALDLIEDGCLGILDSITNKTESK